MNTLDLHTFTRAPTGISEKDQLPLIRQRLTWHHQIGGPCIQIKHMLEVQPGLIDTLTSDRRVVGFKDKAIEKTRERFRPKN